MIRKIWLRNYKSVAGQMVELEPLTMLVGPNGAGKSNFIDALAFLGEAVGESLDIAFKRRGGIGAVRRRSGGHPTHLGLRVAFDLPGGGWADYAFEIAAKPGQRFRVAEERCIVQHAPLEPEHRFQVKDGRFVVEVPGLRPKIEPDRLALLAASAAEEFRPVYDFLTSMRFYCIDPARLRELQEPAPATYLERDGGNAAAVLRRIAREDADDRYGRLCRLLAKAVPGIGKALPVSVRAKETIQFLQDVGQKHPWKFDALNMSDGTLRLLGILLAVYQTPLPSVIGIEEPEATVHPAIADLVVEVLLERSRDLQVLLTTHSPELLDHKPVQERRIRVVACDRGATTIARLAETTRQLVRERLCTLGDLLRNGELAGESPATGGEGRQLDLFG